MARIGLWLSLTLPAAAQLAPPPVHVAPSDERGPRLLFADLHELLPPLLPAHHAAAGDVDGDGDPDLLLAVGLPFLEGSLALWRNIDGRLRTDRDALPAVTGTEFDLPALLDLDGDGDLDATYGTAVLTNDGTGNFTLVPLPLAAAPLTIPPTPVAPATTDVTPGLEWISFDLDRDGDLDALGLRATWVSGGYGVVPYVRNELVLNDGLGLLLRADLVTDELPHLDSITAATLGDLEGDGDLDAFRCDVDRRVYVSEGDGRGRFAAARQWLPTTLRNIPQAARAGDVDGDGDIDLIVQGRDPDGRSFELLRNQGAEAVSESLSTYGEAFELGDVDADGDLDCLVGNERADWREELLRNDGTGRFTLDASFPDLFTDARDVHLADLEGDGDLDAWIAATPPRLLRNDGASWADLSATLPVATALSLAPGDLDGDGDLDLGLSDGADALVLDNRGAAGFSLQGRLLAGGVRVIGALDADLDGDLDLFAAGDSGPSTAFENDGRGLFLRVPWKVPMPVRAAALGDVDGDGDLDALENDGLRFALARELAWRTLAKLGRPVELELRGTPGTPWVLFSARAPSPRDLMTPFGPWRLDPASACRAANGRFGAGGVEVLAFPVPADPALLGQALFWQAAVGSPLRLTNLDMTRLYGF